MAARSVYVQVYQDKAGGWRWRLRARNGRIVADSGEGYSSCRKALDAIARLLDAFRSGLHVRGLPGQVPTACERVMVDGMR